MKAHDNQDRADAFWNSYRRAPATLWIQGKEVESIEQARSGSQETGWPMNR